MLDASSNALTRRYREAVAALNKSDWRQAQHLSMELLRAFHDLVAGKGDGASLILGDLRL